MRNCVDIVSPFFSEVERQHLPVHSLGGIGAEALQHADTIYYPDQRSMFANPKLFIPELRDNGSPHDVDISVLTTNPHHITQVEQIGRETIGDVLEVNVFGLHPMRELDAMRQRPTRGHAILASVSDRYVNPVDAGDATANETYMKAVFPFGVEVPQEAMQTWRLHIGDRPPIPVPHPGIMILNNLTRSIGGPRRKYDKKVLVATANVKKSAPELLDWMIDGPGRSHLVLAGICRAVGSRHLYPRPVIFGEHLAEIPPRFRDIRTHEAFLLRDAPLADQRKALALAKLRGMIVGTVEDNFMDLWEQKGGERFFKGVVRNDTTGKRLPNQLHRPQLSAISLKK